MNSLLGEETNDFGEFSRLSGMLCQTNIQVRKVSACLMISKKIRQKEIELAIGE